jgi:hypothetical protein
MASMPRLLVLLALTTTLHAQKPWPVPPEIASTHFTVTINGQSTPVMHAALNNYFLNFPASRNLQIAVTADSDTFWDHGVDIQPWRLNIRPTRTGRTIRFTISGPAKLSIGRPNDFLADADLLFLFANPPQPPAPSPNTPNVQYFGPGTHIQNIDAATGDTIYLSPGAVVFGSLNIWQVHNVHVFGPGVIVYDGPQNPNDDDGWMHKPNWHCIVMDNASEIEIDDITCVTRSRSWQIQMKGSRNIRFNNLKAIGANPGNANADGMDWLDGSGDTVVTDSFFRAADDVFALQDSWEGYGPAAFAIDGHPVTNIRVESSVLSTSISNIVRAGWPEKSFAGGSFSLSNSDILHAGIGGCGIPFALMEIWADPAGRGQSSGFHFDNLRLDSLYSLLNIQQAPSGSASDISFRDIASLESPSLVPSQLSGAVHSVTLDNITLAGAPVRTPTDLPLTLTDNAPPPTILSTGPTAEITLKTLGLIRPNQPIHLEAASSPGASYLWLFGDGTQATTRTVTHRFPDTLGTLLDGNPDGSGNFRVLLRVTAPNGRTTWTQHPIIVAKILAPALAENTAKDLQIPTDGGYTFSLLASQPGTSLILDGQTLATTPPPFPNVCGLPGDAVRLSTASIALAKGPHSLEISPPYKDARILWQGPNTPLQPITPESSPQPAKTPAAHSN